jgi:hypothetical protein
LANFSLGLVQPWELQENENSTLKALARLVAMLLVNAFSVVHFLARFPRVVASSNPGLKSANAFGVKLAEG